MRDALQGQGGIQTLEDSSVIGEPFFVTVLEINEYPHLESQSHRFESFCWAARATYLH
jgi:hypothetical protein